MSTHDHVEYVDNRRRAPETINVTTRWVTATLLTLVIMVIALLSPTPAIAVELFTATEGHVVLSVQK